MFLLLFLAPDLSALGYLAGKEIGASVYNLFHTYLLPMALAAYGLLAAQPLFFASGVDLAGSHWF